MSRTIVLGVAPDRRPVALAELQNSHGWAPSIWRRLIAHRGLGTGGYLFDDPGLTVLWESIESLTEWEQAALILTFDVGVVPFSAFEWAADGLDEFDQRLPANEGQVNHVPVVARLLRTKPEVPFIGVYGTSVSHNPFDPWDAEVEDYGSGVPLSAMYLLERHRPSTEAHP